MAREISFAAVIMAFTVVTVLTIIPLSIYSSDITVTWTIAAISILGGVVSGRVSTKAFQSEAPKKFAFIFVICAVLLFVTGIFLTAELLI